MVIFREVSGYFNFIKAIYSIEQNAGPVYVLFFGGPSDADSWCPDCNKAKPIIDEVVRSRASEDATFIHVNIGAPDRWRSGECEFRSSPPFPIQKIPTLVRWDTKQALTEEECFDKQKVESIF